MAAPREKRWLVVIVPATPKPKPIVQGGVSGIVGYQQSSQIQSWSAGPPVKVKEVKAATATAAAEAVGVPAGATAYVTALAHVAKFTRPEKAPLVAA